MVKDKPLIVFGKHQFVAEEEDEIEFQTGDPILVLEKDEEFNDGWWKGKTIKGEIGLFPVNFTTPENIFNVNIDLLTEESPKSVEHSYIPNMTDDESLQPAVSPFGTFSNSISLNTSSDGIHRSFIKTSELTNSFGVEIRPSSPGSVNSMRALSSPKLNAASLSNSIRIFGGDLGRNDVSRNKIYSQSNSQSQSQSHYSHTQNSESKVTTISHNQTKNPQEWNVNEVCDWLMSINYEKIIPAVKENKITGEKLLELNLSKLREFGIHSLSERIELLHEILVIREECNNDDQDSKCNNSNEESSDFESYNDSKFKKSINKKIQEAPFNLSLGEFNVKSDDFSSNNLKNFEDEVEESKPKYYDDEWETSNTLKNIMINQDSLNYDNNKRHHELPVSANLYLSPEIPNSNPLSSSYGGGMTGIAGISMGLGNRNRSLSLENIPLKGNMQYNVNNVSNSSLPNMGKTKNKTKIDLRDADYKGWLFVRFDNETSWNRRWVVVLDGRLYILKSSTDQEKNSGDGGTRISQILNAIELNSNCTVLPDIIDKSRPHNFLFKDPILGIIHLAASDQLGVVTWINYIVRACNNSLNKTMPLIPLKNIGRQTKEAIQTRAAQVSDDYYQSKANKKNGTNMGISDIYTNPFLTNRINQDAPISPTQTAAAALNGWYRTNAKSATDYSNYRNLKQVSQETRLRLQKTAKITEPVVMTPILNASNIKSFNPNQIESNDEFGTSSENNLLGFNKKPDYITSFSSNSNHNVSSNYFNLLQVQNNFSTNPQVSPIEMMERRGIGSFITNNRSKKTKKAAKKNSILFW